jgi:hypothetical protein
MNKPTLTYLLGTIPLLPKLILFSIVLTLFSFPQDIFAQTLAFPGAEGFGKYASGGRGGSVLKVTNLNSTGAGSLRAALVASGPRTVVFEVGGTIDLQGNDIDIENGNITIAGQTAPGDGILIKNGRIQIEASNVIVRYIRSRSGLGPEEDGISITAYSGNLIEDIIFDHCSISWATDGNFDLRGVGTGLVRNVTIQHSLLAECTKNTLLWGNVDSVTYYENLLALTSERNIRTGNNTTDFAFEMINNLIYGFRYATQITPDSKFTVLNNKYKASSQVSVLTNNIVEPTGTVTSNSYAYVSGNIVPNGTNEHSSSYTSEIESTPYKSSGIVAILASEIEDDLLAHVGASYPNRDDVDTRIINNWINGNGTTGSIGTYPTISNGTAPTDSDNDGMPNSWEENNGLNINDPNDRNVVQPDGYTNLEYFLNFMSLTAQVNAGQDENICDGQTASLTATGAVSYVWNTGATTATISVNPTSTTTYSVTGTHGDGSTSTDSVTVNVNAIPTADAGQDATICEGDSRVLTASGGTSYLWNTGQTSQNITVSPNADTTYSVTVFQNGCEDSDSVTVNVNPLPTADAGLDVSMLVGENVTLNATGGQTYLWDTGETTSTIIVSPPITTTYSVTVFQDGCQDTDSVTVTVEEEVIANAGDDVTICEGDTTTLTASGGSDYLWNTGETTQNITVNPVIDTTYSVTVSSGNSSDQDDVTVFVNPMPNVDAGNDVSINDGESTTLTATGTGTFEWSTGETTASITVSPTQTTTYTVIISLNGCENFDEVIVTVNGVANANAGEDTSICDGSETILTATGGDSYIWNTGETTQSITVSPTATSTYTVIVSIDNSSDTDDVTVFVNPNPDVQVSSDTTILEGEFITISASGADTYEWSNGATLPNIAVSPSVTTIYAVTGFINECFDTKEVTVSVVDQVQANAGEDEAICLGDSILLSASGGDSYVWSTGETTQEITVTPEEDTMYTVLVSNQLDSDSADVMVIVEDCENEIPEESDTYAYDIYYDQFDPEQLNIKLSGLEGVSRLLVHDIGGKLIHQEEIQDNNGDSITKIINTSFFTKGVYIITLLEQAKQTTKKIVFY